MWVIYSYNKYSKSASELSKALAIPVVNSVKNYQNVINWGSSEWVGDPIGREILNRPEFVSNAVNKIKTFSYLNYVNVPTVPFTLDRNQAKAWIRKGNIVYCRTELSSSSGDGIIIAKEESDIPEYCPLFTKGIISPAEYRVHVFNNKVIDVTLKKKVNGSEANPLVRNYTTNWIFAREDIYIPKVITTWARYAINRMRLNFGAVDILYKNGLAFVLEINTAPGMQGTTLDRYVKEFKEIVYETK